MEGTLLNKISKCPNDTIVTDAWLTGQTGMIVDLQNDCVFRFVDYINDNGKLRKKHTTKASMLSCPVVACGIVGYWLHEKDTKGIKELFEDYYNMRMMEYVKAHANDADSWKRDLEKEFVCNYHIFAEKELIKRSEVLFDYVTKKDQEDIQKIMDNYLSFARSQYKKLYPSNYPADRIIEETFLDGFREGGPACICLNWLRSEYNLPNMGPHRNNGVKTSKSIFSDDLKKEFDKIIFEDIAEKFEDFDFDVLLSKNGGLMEEIHEIIKNLKTQEDRKRYIIYLILQFKDFAEAFEPKAKIDEIERKINVQKIWIKKWEEMPDDAVDEKNGNPILPKNQIAASNEAIENLNKDIEYLKKVQNDLYGFVKLGCNSRKNKEYSIEVKKMCKYLRDWWYSMAYFANRLASLTLSYRINLKDLQEECGIYLLRQLSIHNYVDKKYIASAEYARKLLDEIDPKNPQAEPNNNMLSATSSSTKKSKKPSNKKKDIEKNIAKPKTLKYYNHGNKGKLKNQQRRVLIIYRWFTEWKWIDDETTPDYFDSFFEGKPMHCNIIWKANSTILTILLQELLKQPYIQKQKGCSASSLVNQQFGKTPNSDRKRLNEEAEFKIKVTLHILDPNNPLPLNKESYQEEEYDESFEAACEIYENHLRSTKGI